MRGALGVGLGNHPHTLRLATGEQPRLVSLGLGQGTDAVGLLQRALVLRLALVALDRDRQLGLGDTALRLGHLLGLAQLALAHRRVALPGVGLELLRRHCRERSWWRICLIAPAPLAEVGVPISTSSSWRL